MPDQNQQYPYNIPGARSLPPSGQAGDVTPPSPPAPQVPQPAPRPDVTPEVKPETPQAAEPKPEVKQEAKEAAAPVKKRRGLPPLLILGILLFGFAVAGLLFSLLAKMMADRRAASAPQIISTAGAKTRTIIEEVPVEEEDIVTSLVAVTKARREMPALTLGGILYSKEEGSVALINGRVVPEGGMVKGVTVVRVLPDKVELEFDGRRIFMRSL